MKLFILSLVCLSTLALAIPNEAIAQGLVTCSGADCTICSLALMTNNIIQWLFGFLTICAVLVFVYAGVKLVTSGGDTAARDFAKARLTAVIVGFLLMLASWLIVDTILKGLTGTGLEVWGSFEVDQCGGQRESKQDDDLEGIAEADNVTDLEFDAQEFTGDLNDPNFYTNPNNRFTIAQSGSSGSSGGGGAGITANACLESELRNINFMGSGIRVQSSLVPSLQRIEAEWRRRGGNASFYRVDVVFGYDCRSIAGSGNASAHSYGLAVDINPDQNPHCKVGSYRWPVCEGKNKLVTNMPQEFVDIFTSEGWGWGGNWRSSKDAMHFSKLKNEGGNMSAN